MCEFAMEDTSVKNLFASNKIVLFLKWVTYGWIKYGFMTDWLCIFLFLDKFVLGACPLY